MSASKLLEYNPWWKNKKAIESDPDIQSWNESALNGIQDYIVPSTWRIMPICYV